ncbi:predicted protein [Aspergillus nidulans FGSC A4]|uniref:Uncharacterized protein n=1 Tax=Emericella nidulans (strain FGSC A4 / ATCC 38163 / CBS 112.46 / NRRL 194 / M139) TaxID=227321 RepID=Q5BD05_EMENI|nr:hypothetical protein [Aspergillus nidulans FGSC A4]EAA64282.1 predicted protein [Aspergillus nidulans FGSC A4]CBF85144.1 TPA: conserved hypothetical protein [Aspergillus nidulans FGSC A4]|eukprot:XP_659179.1 predicted protein [Aspergillus nidulans FGSC A4]
MRRPRLPVWETGRQTDREARRLYCFQVSESSRRSATPSSAWARSMISSYSYAWATRTARWQGNERGDAPTGGSSEHRAGADLCIVLISILLLKKTRSRLVSSAVSLETVGSESEDRPRQSATSLTIAQAFVGLYLGWSSTSTPKALVQDDVRSRLFPDIEGATGGRKQHRHDQHIHERQQLPWETEYNAYFARFQHAVEMAKQLLTAASSMKPMPTFAVNEALLLLCRWRRYKGIWSSGTAARVLTRVIEIETVGLVPGNSIADFSWIDSVHVDVRCSADCCWAKWSIGNAQGQSQTLFYAAPTSAILSYTEPPLSNGHTEPATTSSKVTMASTVMAPTPGLPAVSNVLPDISLIRRAYLLNLGGNGFNVAVFASSFPSSLSWHRTKAWSFMIGTACDRLLVLGMRHASRLSRSMYMVVQSRLAMTVPQCGRMNIMIAGPPSRSGRRHDLYRGHTAERMGPSDIGFQDSGLT